MAASSHSSPAASRAPNQKSAAAAASPSPSTRRAAADEAPSAARFAACSRLQEAAAAFGEKLPIPEIVVIGGVGDGKSSVLEGLLGFRFNIRCESTLRPLVLQMVHDPAAIEPRFRFQEEDSEEYGSEMVMATAIADLIKQRTESHLRKIQAEVSSKPIVIRAEYAHCPTLTIIDTPGLVLQAERGEPESTPDEILAMVKSLASPPDRLLLFVQQSSVQWDSSIWLRTLKEIDPTFSRTIIVISKFDNRLQEFVERRQVDAFLGAHGYLRNSYLGDNIHPFVVALPMGCRTISNEEFRSKICQVDTDVLCHLRGNVEGGFNEEKYGSYIGFSCLRKYLESELQKRYKEAAPATLKLLEQRCTQVSMDLTKLDSKLATVDVSQLRRNALRRRLKKNVSQLRRSAIRHVHSFCKHQNALLDGAIGDTICGKTTEEEQMQSGITSWPGINMPVKPANSSLKLYGRAAFARLMHELRCAAYSMECPQVSREQVANKLATLVLRGGSSRLIEVAAEIARAAARSWLAPLIDIACDRLAFVLKSLYDLAMERKRKMDSQNRQNVEDMGSYVGFLVALQCSYYKFVEELTKQCKQEVHDQLELICRRIVGDDDFLSGLGFVANSMTRFTRVTFFDITDSGYELEEAHENLSPRDQQDMTPPSNKGNESKELLRGNQLIVPEVPSPDLPSGIRNGKKKDNGTPNDGGPRKRHARMAAHTNRNHLNSMIGADDMGSKSGSFYSTICTISAQYFAKMREALIEKNVPSALNSGFITPCRETLFLALDIDLFAVSDDKFKDMFAPGAVDVIQNERQSLLKLSSETS